MTTLTDTQVITASGGLVELGYSQITTGVNVVSTTAGSGTEIIAPLTVVCDGGPVLVEFYSPAATAPQVAGGGMYTALYQDGTEAVRFWGNMNTDSGSPSAGQQTPLYMSRRLTPSAGSHTFGVKSYVTSTTGTPNIGAGTGTGTTAAPAFLRVSKIVQATQWPAVTTGTIICTSSTRPASPFEGQRIYESDTKRSWTYIGTQWVPDDMVFTNEAARDAAITSPTEGMRAYLTAPTVPAATGGSTFVPTGVTTIYNGSAWVCTTAVSAVNNLSGTTASTTYTATLGGSPGTNCSVTLATGTTAIVNISCFLTTTTVGQTALASVAVSGATTLAASDNSGIMLDISTASYAMQSAWVGVISGLTAGTNTFTMQYRVTGGTGTFQRRNLTVQGIA